MATIQERLATRMRWWADEGNLGYDWDYPDRNHFYVGGETDCSSMVIHVCQECGLDVGGATYTGNMRAEFTKHDWKWIPGRPSVNSLQVGDVLLRESTHTAMYVGNGLISQASANEFGGASGGKPGDQGRPNGIGETNTVSFNPSYAWDGVLRYVGPDPDAPKRSSQRPTGKETGMGSGTVIRVYNPSSGDHLWTLGSAEADNLVKAGWKKEGTPFKVSATGDRVYRMYNPFDGRHMWTRSLNEAQVLWDSGWESEGCPWCSNGKVPVWRLYNPQAGQHFYTADNYEHANLVDKNGFRQEGVGFWAEG